jgi:hypothetical protein
MQATPPRNELLQKLIRDRPAGGINAPSWPPPLREGAASGSSTSDI